MIRRCTNYHCRTSLDEQPIECPHGLAFCEHCTWEDGCDDCHIDLLKSRADTAWNAEPDHTWIDPRNQADIDTAAEEQRDRRACELAHLEDREEQGRYGAA